MLQFSRKRFFFGLVCSVLLVGLWVAEVVFQMLRFSGFGWEGVWRECLHFYDQSFSLVGTIVVVVVATAVLLL